MTDWEARDGRVFIDSGDGGKMGRVRRRVNLILLQGRIPKERGPGPFRRGVTGGTPRRQKHGVPGPNIPAPPAARSYMIRINLLGGNTNRERVGRHRWKGIYRSGDGGKMGRVERGQPICPRGAPGGGAVGPGHPGGAQKPGDPRRQRQEPGCPQRGGPVSGPHAADEHPFAPGHCEETIQNMPAGPRREIALAEYHYFSGQAEKAMQETERYLTAGDRAIRLSAGWIFCLFLPDHGADRPCPPGLAGDPEHAGRQRERGAHGGAMQAFVAFGAAVCCTCRCRRNCRRQRNFFRCCLRACGPLPCMCRPTTCT